MLLLLSGNIHALHQSMYYLIFQGFADMTVAWMGAAVRTLKVSAS